MKNLKYELRCENVHFHTTALPRYQFELVDFFNESTDYSPTIIATYNNMLDAMRALADKRCTAWLVHVCNGMICLADMYYIEEVEIIDSETDRCVLTGNRWFATCAPLVANN